MTHTQTRTQTRTPSRLVLPAIALFLAAASLPLRAVVFDSSAAADDTAYTTGTRAMNEHRWADAVTSFDRVVETHGRRSDAALYWKAYSLNKLGDNGLAMATCNQLRSRYTTSQWNRDCGALAINVRTDVSVPIPPISPIPPNPPVTPIGGYHFDIDNPDAVPLGSDADLKFLALNSLLNRDPEKAIPVLRGILTSDGNPGIKKHAIFVLAQSKSPEAQAILRDVVLGKLGGPDLQRQAIQMSAVFQGKAANPSLLEVYRTTSDPEIKRSVINAFFITRDAPRMVDLARAEKDLEIKRRIVSQLALMPDKSATDYMMELLK